MALFEIALLVGVLALVGYFWPQAFSPLEWVGIGNPFRNTKWVKRLNPPWLMPVVYVLAIVTLEARTHGIVPMILGAIIFGATFVPDFFEHFLGENWNFTTWKHMRTIGILTFFFGLGVFVWMKPFVDLAIIVAIAYQLWRHDPEFFRTMLGWFKGSKKAEESA